MRTLGRLSLVGLVALLLATPVLGQFGKNKIAYDRFDWQIYHSPHFDIHYYGATEEFLEEIVSYAESAYVKISKDLDHELRFRVPLVVYKTHAEFEQTNITLSELPEAVGAFAEPVQYRMVLPIDMPPAELYALIAHELTHIFQYSILFEGSLGRTIRANPPTWLIEGMASYLADDETNLDRMAIRDAVVNNILPPIQALNVLSFLTYRYGHAVFDFIEEEHGLEGLRTFIFEYRKVLLTNNIGKAIQEALGYDIDEFNRQFNRYLRRKYFPILLEKKSPDDYGTEIGIKRPGTYTFSPTISPSGELIATLSTLSRFELDVVVLTADDGDKVKNLTKGFTNNYQNLVAEAFSGRRDLSWSPTGDQVAVFAKREGRRILLIYNALTGKKEKTLKLGDIAQNASPAFSPDGTKIAFEGNRDGVVDIFEIDVASGEVRNVTQDGFWDSNPWYSPDGESLLYNRRIGDHWKVFSVDRQDPTRKIQLTFGPSSDIQPSYSRDGQRIYFSSDRTPEGIYNIYSLDLTTGTLEQYTDVVGGCFAPTELAERDGERYVAFVSYYRGTFRLYRMPVMEPEQIVEAEDSVEVAEAEPFQSALQLSVDENQKEPYKLRWNIDAPLINVGVADDGTFLSNVAVQFSDLLGDHRVQLIGSSVAGFSNFQAIYFNLKKRYRWGGSFFDFRDFFVTEFGSDQIQRTTGVSAFIQYPFSRYYRIESSVGFTDSTQDLIVTNPFTFASGFVEVDEQFATASFEITGDTTRYQSFGAFQGKRFNLGVLYGYNLDSDIPDGFNIEEGDILRYTLDFRAYKKATRRSLLAWRLRGIYNDGDRETFHGLGGINQLRGWDYLEFFGSRVAWSNLEFRFPLADELRFPILAIRQIRGFFFFDVGAAWLREDEWFDPELNNIRISPQTGQPIKFKFWDSDEDRLQDGRASYGAGFSFFFLGGLQFNWAWSKRLEYTQFVPVLDPSGFFIIDLQPVEVDDSDTRMDFYIVFDW
jgi:Tol biopolymer transport system component